jgi:hypothetical protein
VRGQPGQQRRKPLVELRAGQPPVLSAYVDQAEIARAENVEPLVAVGLARPLAVAGLDRLGVVAPAALHRVGGVAHRAAADPAAGGELVHQDAGPAPTLDVGGRHGDVGRGES